MSLTAIYTTTVVWKGEHSGTVSLGNGPLLEFSAPPESHGASGVLTPEDAFVAAVNTCIMLVFIWSCERLKIDLVAYQCRAEGTKVVELDHTERFTQVRLSPQIKVNGGDEPTESVETRLLRALKAAQKYSLVANSIKSELIIDPQIEIIDQKHT